MLMSFEVNLPFTFRCHALGVRRSCQVEMHDSLNGELDVQLLMPMQRAPMSYGNARHLHHLGIGGAI